MWLPILITALMAYLLGNLNGSVCVSALAANDDVRSHGSGNAGLTNFIRNYGVGNALFVVLIDAGKTVISCLAAGFILEPYGYRLEGMMLGAVAVMLGHDFPALLGFRGGKGILSGLFIALVMDWRIALLGLTLFAVTYLITQYVSLSSIVGSIAFGVGFALFFRSNPVVLIGGVFMSCLAIFMHRDNIVRLVKGTERRTNLFRKGKKQ